MHCEQITLPQCSKSPLAFITETGLEVGAGHRRNPQGAVRQGSWIPWGRLKARFAEVRNRWELVNVI
jgi:hypothetical protein